MENIDFGAENLTFIDIYYFLHFFEDGLLAEVGGNIADFQDSFPLIVGWRVGHQSGHFLCFVEAVNFFENIYKIDRCLYMLWKTWEVVSCFDEDRGNHFR